MNPSPAKLAGSLTASGDGGLLELLFIIIVFFCILLLAYYLTRFVAKRASGRLKSRHMEVVDTLGIGADSQLLLIKAGDEFLLVSKTQKQLSFLTKLEISPEAVNAADARQHGPAGGFRAILESGLLRAGAESKKGGKDDHYANAGANFDANADENSDTNSSSHGNT